MEIITKVKLVAGEGMYLTKKNRDENQEPIMLKVADLNSAENKDASEMLASFGNDSIRKLLLRDQRLLHLRVRAFQQVHTARSPSSSSW
jgi:hypothetical protein